MGIIPGGGYAEYVAVCKDHLIEIPDSIPIDLVLLLYNKLGWGYLWNLFDSLFAIAISKYEERK